MSYKRVIQLRKLKDKVSKRYFVKIRFYHRNSFLFEEKYDIHDLVVENQWKSITAGESIVIFKHLFDIYTGKYILAKNNDRTQYDYWTIKEEDGFSICLKDEDLSKLRHSRIEKLGI